MCTHQNKCRCYRCLCTGDGSLLNVKSREKNKVYITILLFTGTLRSSLNDKLSHLSIYIKKNEMVWILLLVHITLHGMIGGLSKRFPNAVAEYSFHLFKKKTRSECQKKLFLLNLCINASVTLTHTMSTIQEERESGM